MNKLVIEVIVNAEPLPAIRCNLSASFVTISLTEAETFRRLAVSSIIFCAFVRKPRRLFCMADLRVPIISVIVGEGGSGGALAIGMGNRVLMLENSVYSVISPEGCASILWGDKSKVEHAAKALCMTAEELTKLKIIDMIVREPIGGAHRHPKQAAIQLKKVLKKSLDELAQLSPEEIIKTRQEKFRNMGEFLQES